ncbi:MAG: ABC transporter permease, partial [Vicinamibacteria bacterium]
MKHALYVGWRRWHFAAPILCVLTLATATAGALAGGIRQAVVPHPVVGEPEGLVLLWSVERETGGSNRGIVPGAQLLGWRQRLQGVEGIAALRVWHSSRSASIDFSGEQGPERLRGVLATPNVFDVLRLRPLVGRVFGAADAERSDLVVLGEGFWRRAYGGDPRAVGRSLRLAADAVNPATGIPERSTRPFLVLGVVPDGVSVVPRDTPDVWVMTPWSDVERGPLRPFQYHVVARLKPGTSVEALGD